MRAKIGYLLLSTLFFILNPLMGQEVQDTGIQQNDGQLPVYEVFLLGDAGEYFPGSINPLFPKLREQLAKASENSALIVLGDNIYPRGMPNLRNKHRKAAETSITDQINLAKNFDGQIYFIPGNHDWKKGKKEGFQQILNQQEFIENMLDSANVFLPDNGCPGPVEVNLSKEITLIIIDSQWILHPWEKPGEDACPSTSYEEFVVSLEDIILRNEDKKIIFAAHHPLYSYGIHGGVTTFKQHLFPLTEISDPLYIPLPIIGSLYPLYRSWIGNIQDIRHPKYKTFRDVLAEIFHQHPNLIHVAGHEHSMQYIKKDSVHYIVSGSGSKSTPVKQKGYSLYGNERVGFSKLVFYDQGLVRLEIWQLDEQNELINTYQTKLFNKPYVEPTPVEELNLDFSDSTIVTNASDRYESDKTKMFGENYRSVWKQPVEIPLFDIGKEKDGLKIIQRGGGQQTRSLRLEANDGKQYVLRSVEKYAEKAVPPMFRGTIAAELVQDQVSASHPYGAFVIPPLAEAVGIYHTNPKVVFLPEDPRLGRYENRFSNGLFLFEERPAGDLRDYPNFGSTKDAISTPKLLKELYKDNDNQVDQLFTLKSRLFDMVIADWDRHDDQWRWATFKVKDGKKFRPIPRDRDQAFFINDGFFMSKIAKRKWVMPKFQGFDYNYRDVPGFNFNARYFDRDFLNEPSREDWINTADSIKNSLSDEVINQAIKKWPEEIYALSGKEVVEKLKSLRDNLDQIALKQYLFLSKIVTVHGSNKHEYFKIERLNNEETRVRVYKKKKDENEHEDKLLYDRTFKLSETKEIRLFGFDGKDVFTIDGNVKKGPIIRIIGGEDEDQILERSRVKGMARKTKIYDTADDNIIEFGSEGADRTSQRDNINNYDRREFKYNKLVPLITGNINQDDGLFIGGGFMAHTHGFRKTPTKSSHYFIGNYAFQTNAFYTTYEGAFHQALGSLDVLINADVLYPNFTINFFGYGNETENNQNANQDYNVPKAIDYYRIRFNVIQAEALLRKNIGQDFSISFGPMLQIANVEDEYDDEDRIFLDPTNVGEDENFFKRKSFTGLKVDVCLDTKDHKFLPTRGINLGLETKSYVGNNPVSRQSSSYHAFYAQYFSMRLPTILTIAARVGGGQTYGDYEFYQGQFLGGIETVRGYRRTRFVGNARVYQNTEFRLHVANLRNRFVPTTFGISAFNDVGRVWLEGESSQRWHHGYGGGIWFAPLNAAVFTAEFANSEEGFAFYARVGFMF